MNTIEKFYTAFSKGDAESMVECYADNVVFSDPAFGTLNGDQAKAMWRMLLKDKAEGEISVSFKVLEASESRGKANWEAIYLFGPSKRKVHNKISATMELENGKIVKHTDEFNLWKWTSMAFGIRGYLIGWTPVMKRILQKGTNKALDKFMKNN